MRICVLRLRKAMLKRRYMRAPSPYILFQIREILKEIECLKVRIATSAHANYPEDSKLEYQVSPT